MGTYLRNFLSYDPTSEAFEDSCFTDPWGADEDWVRFRSSGEDFTSMRIRRNNIVGRVCVLWIVRRISRRMSQESTFEERNGYAPSSRPMVGSNFPSLAISVKSTLFQRNNKSSTHVYKRRTHVLFESISLFLFLSKHVEPLAWWKSRWSLCVTSYTQAWVDEDWGT